MGIYPCISTIPVSSTHQMQGGSRVGSLGHHAVQFLAVSSENNDFPKKLFNMKIFRIKLVIKKVILIFGVRRSLLLKNARVLHLFGPCEPTFGPPCICTYIFIILLYIFTSTACLAYVGYVYNTALLARTDVMCRLYTYTARILYSYSLNGAAYGIICYQPIPTRVV